jgi:hypothetical protein
MRIDDGRYRTMFELQASRFASEEPWDDEDVEALDAVEL